jgi:excisionase family DNA binding protein
MMMPDRRCAVEDERWLTVDEVAERVSMHPDTVRRLLREGRIKGHLINRRAGWRVKAQDVERFVTGGQDADVRGLHDHE